MPRSVSSTPESSIPVEREENTASDEGSIYSGLSLAARIDLYHEERQRLRQLLRSSALHGQENEGDRLLAQFRPLTEQNQTRNNDTASVPLGGALGAPASPTSSDLASDPEDEIDFMRMDPRMLERDFAIHWPQESLLRDMIQIPSQEHDRQSFEVEPAMTRTNNSDSASMSPQLIPSLRFYPAGETGRPEDNLNRPALESGVGEVNQFAGTGSSTADRDNADVDGAMVEHVEVIRNHRLIRYYELMEAYSYMLRRWCQQVHHQVINHAHGIRLPTPSLERMPTIHSTFWDIGRHLLSHDHQRIATAAQRIQNFLLRWSENRGPAHRILQSIEEVPLLEQFTEVLLQEGMEQERMVWEPVVQLHTGRRLNTLLLAFESLRFVSLQINNTMTLDEESTSEEDESTINMDVVDGIRPYRYFG